MRRLSFLAVAMLVCGCGKGKISEPEEKPTPKPLAVAELLKKSRAELAALEKECADKIALEVKDFDETPGATEKEVIRFPLATPIWQDAAYSQQAGMTLPRYLRPGTRDNALAWHLARHGDLDAAKRLADPGEADSLTALHRSLYERNYPVEWTRLLARKMQLAQLTLRRGGEDAAGQIISLHRELVQFLDARARRAPLGSTLLGLGRRALREGTAALKGEKAAARVKADQEALASWGELPGLAPALLPGISRPLVERLWGCKSEGPVLVAKDIVRALDSSALPLPSAGVQAILACFGPDDKLREVAVLYRARLNLALPRTADLAHHLEEHSLPVTEQEEFAGLRRAVYTLGSQRLEVVLSLTNGRLGGIVRLRGADAADAAPGLRRDFGSAHLDAAFEDNRLRCAPKQLGDVLTFSGEKALAGLRLPLAGFRPVESVLERGKGSPRTRRLLVRGEADTSVARCLASPLIGARGFGTIVGEDGSEGRLLAFVWQDGRTRYALRLPNAAQAPCEFDALSLEPGESGGTPKGVDDLRRKRLAAGKPWKPLPRALLSSVRLGMTRADAEQALPRAEKVAFGLRQTFTPRQFSAPSFVPRQLIVRFAADRVAEVRLLLVEKTGGNSSLFASLQEKYGVTQTLPARWTSAWRGVIDQAESASLHFWHDDLTLMTYERLNGVAEWVLRDRPAEQESGIALERLTFCPRGVESCRLGATRANLLKDWKGNTAKDTSGEVVTLFPPGESRFDAVLVWFKDDRAVRIVARHKAPKGSELRPGQMAKALNTAWGEILSTVGWWSARGSRDGSTTFLGWLDDRTRMRLFWNDDDGSPRVFSEWVDVPASGPLPALR